MKRVLPWPRTIDTPAGVAADFKEGFQIGFAEGMKAARDVERGRRMVKAREARLGRTNWRAKALHMDHELYESRPSLSRKRRAEIIAGRLELHWRAVYECLYHHPRYAHGQRPRRHRR